MSDNKLDVPIWEKVMLTKEEAAVYSLVLCQDLVQIKMRGSAS